MVKRRIIAFNAIALAIDLLEDRLDVKLAFPIQTEVALGEHTSRFSLSWTVFKFNFAGLFLYNQNTLFWILYELFESMARHLFLEIAETDPGHEDIKQAVID